MEDVEVRWRVAWSACRRAWQDMRSYATHPVRGDDHDRLRLAGHHVGDAPEELAGMRLASSEQRQRASCSKIIMASPIPPATL
jgi:hypothetical protein